MNSVKNCLQLDRKCEPAVTFSSRINCNDLSSSMEDRCHNIKTRVHDIRSPRTRMLERCKSVKDNYCDININFIFGKPYDNVQSSKFCPSEMIKVLQDTCDLMDDYTYGKFYGKKNCQCSYDWPTLADTNRRKCKRRKVVEPINENKSISTKCMCQSSPETKISLHPGYYTDKKKFSEIVREMIGCYGEKQKITNDDLCNRILEEYPTLSNRTEILRFVIKDSLGELPSNFLMSRRYLDTSVSSIAFKCLVKGCIECIQDIKVGDDLIIVNIPLLTRLYVGLLYVIGIKVLHHIFMVELNSSFIELKYFYYFM